MDIALTPISRSLLSPIEIVRMHDQRTGEFFAKAGREALNTLWDFNVVRYERTYDIAALDADRLVGALRMRVASSLGYIDALVVLPEMRCRGIGRRLVDSSAEIANYNNCHKLTVQVPHRSGAQAFFERCGFKEEAVLPQHEWKKDVAMLRKFLL